MNKNLELKAIRHALSTDLLINSHVFDDVTSKNLKVMYVGISTGLLKYLQSRSIAVMEDAVGAPPGVAPSYTSSGDWTKSHSTIINIKVHRRSIQYPYITFMPLNFIFDMSMFIQRDDFVYPEFWINSPADAPLAERMWHLINFTRFNVEGMNINHTAETQWDTTVWPFERMEGRNWYAYANPEAVPGLDVDEAQNPATLHTPKPHTLRQGWEWLGTLPTNPEMNPNYMADAVLRNHFYSHALQRYYKILTGLNLDEETFGPKIATFGKSLCITEKAVQLLEEFAQNHVQDGGGGGVHADYFVTIGEYGITIPAPPLLVGTTEGFVIEPPDTILFPPHLSPVGGAVGGAGKPPVPPIEVQLRKVKDPYQDGVLSTPGHLDDEKYSNFRTLMLSADFQAPALTEYARTVKAFDRVFALPIDIDDFVINSMEQDWGNTFFQSLLDQNIIEELESTEAFPNMKAMSKFYRMNRDKVGTTNESQDFNDHYIADQFWVEVELMGETPLNPIPTDDGHPHPYDSDWVAVDPDTGDGIP